MAHGLSCSVACGIFPDQGSNLCPLHWQADSYPLCLQRSLQMLWLQGRNSLLYLKPKKEMYWFMQLKSLGLDHLAHMIGTGEMDNETWGTLPVASCFAACSPHGGSRWLQPFIPRSDKPEKRNFSVLVSSSMLEADGPVLIDLHWVTLPLNPLAVPEWQNGPIALAWALCQPWESGCLSVQPLPSGLMGVGDP